MKRKIMWFVLSFLMALSLVLASCGEAVEEEEEEEEGPPPMEEEVEEEEEEEGPPITGNWWDKLGEPDYGGTFTKRVNLLTAVFDMYLPGLGAPYNFYETMVTFDWTVDREEWPYNTNFAPLKYHQGLLAESWERTDPQTMTFKLREGIHWQDKPPVNGRELNAQDIQHHYDRFLGIGSGYTQPSFAAGWMSLVEKVTATGKYTVTVKFKEASILAVFQFFDQSQIHMIEAPEVVAMGGINDWDYAVGTGPWILTDFVAGSSVTFKKNTNYWGYDERHPQNQLPYADNFRILYIPDIATAMAALRTGKVDMLSALTWEQMDSLKRTNPELQSSPMPGGGGSVEFRCDKEPFTDINVRKALQLSIDRQTVAETHYGGTVDGIPVGLMSPEFPGFHFSYEDWPQELKDEYSYNPERARQLLAEAGYPDGFKTNVLAASNVDLDLLQIIRGYYSDINVDMEIQVMDNTALRNLLRAGRHDAMYYHSGTHCATTRPPHNILYSRYSEDVLNDTFNNDAGYDALIGDFEASADEDELSRVVTAADRYIIEKHWALYLFPIVTYYGYQPYLKGYSGEAFGATDALYWARMWIDQDLKESMER